MAEAYIVASHQLKYTNEEPLPVADVIASLQALNRITASFLPRALTKLTGAQVIGAELLIKGIEQGSFVEDFVIPILFGSEHDKKIFLEKVHAVGAKFVTRHPVISVTLLALIAAGVYWAWSASGDEKERALIEANNNQIIMIGAEAYKIDPAAFSQLLDTAVGAQKKKLAQDAAQIIAPARREAGAAMVLDDNSNLQIPPDVVRATPQRAEFGTRESAEGYKDVDLQIRATDRDSQSRGWAAVIPNIVDRRVKVVLGQGVDANQLAGRASVRADVTVIFKPDAKGKLRPSQINVDQVIEDSDQ